MADHEPATVRRRVNGFLLQLDTCQRLAAEVPQKFIVIARHINHPRAGSGNSHKPPHDRLMAFREVHPPLHSDQINDIPDQVQGLAADVVEKIQKVVRLTIGGSQVNIGNENAPVLMHRLPPPACSRIIHTLSDGNDDRMTARRQFSDGGRSTP